LFKLSPSRLILVFALFAASNASSQTIDFDAVDVSITHVRGPIYVIEGLGGKIGVSAGDDGVFIVDDQYAPLAPKILQAIRSVSSEPIRFVINTHWHGDHMGGNKPIVEAEGSVVIAHDNAREHLIRDFDNQLWGLVEAADEAAWPIMTFDQNLSLHLNGEEARLVYVPDAHTDSDIVVWFKNSNVLHTGDAYAGGYPLLDWPSGGTIDGFLNAYQVLYEMVDDQTIIIPGHGGFSNRDALTRSHEAVRQIRDRIKVMISEGATEDEAVRAKPTAEWDSELANGFVNGEYVTRTFYQSLTNTSIHSHD
jgi:cyclase